MHSSRKLQLEQATLMLLGFMVFERMCLDTGQGEKILFRAHYRLYSSLGTYVCHFFIRHLSARAGHQS